MCQMFIHSSVNGHLGYFHYAKPSIYKQSCLTLTVIVHGSTIMGPVYFFLGRVGGGVFIYLFHVFIQIYTLDYYKWDYCIKQYKYFYDV